MANIVPIKKSFAAILGFLLVFGTLGPSGLALNIEVANAATYSVINTDDSGAGSFRQAVLDANANPGIDSITFAPLIVTGTITLATGVTITDTLVIDGTTLPNSQTGPDITIQGADSSFAPITYFISGSENIIKGIALRTGSYCLDVSQTTGITIGGTGARDGNWFDGCGDGIHLAYDSNTTINGNLIGGSVANTNGISAIGSESLVIGDPVVKNIIISNTTYGMTLAGVSGVTIEGNNIGTQSGSNDRGNGNAGIFLDGISDDITVQNNVISGNGGSGVYVWSGTVTNTAFQGNKIGVNAAGTAALSNGQDGIITNSPITIGGDTSGTGNVISGNGATGITVQSVTGSTIQGNTIGLNAAGTAAIPNITQGIILLSTNGTLVGGTTSLERNIISGNTLGGVLVNGSSAATDANIIEGNYIGLNTAGTAAIANGGNGVRIIGADATNTEIGVAGYGNVISGNTSQGIFLGGGTGTSIQANIIGLDAAGTLDLGNGSSGIYIEADGNSIGTTNDLTAKNIISGNDSFGIFLNVADGNTIVNNVVGFALDEVTSVNNTDGGIAISNTSTSNTVGGVEIGAKNLISAADTKTCISLITTAGHFNAIRGNDCPTESATIYNIVRNGTSNENVGTPTLTAETATTSLLEGRGVANGTIDIFGNGLYLGSAAIDADGVWSKAMSIASGTQVSVSSTNGTNSTSSSTSPQITVADDVTVPTTPVVLTPSADTVGTTTATLAGTKEVNTSLWIDGVQQVAIDSSIFWTVTDHPLVEGLNVFAITSKDYSNNVSGTETFELTSDTITPTIPVLSYPPFAVISATITGSGTEAGANVYINTSDCGTDVDEFGNFSVTVPIVDRTKRFSITIVDDAGNTSEAIVATITSTTGTVPHDGISSHETTVIDTIVEEDGTQSIAGDTEITTDNVTVDVDSSTSSTDTSVTQTVDNTKPVKSDKPDKPDKPVKPVKPDQVAQQNGQKTFYDKINQIIQPIKTHNLRENLPEKPVKPSEFNSAFIAGKFLGQKNEDNIPEILIDIKLGGEDPGPDRDTDGDGLTDYEELIYGGDPEVKDSDGDGSTDLEEVYYDGTDPESYDTDKDGTPDNLDSEPLSFSAPSVSPTQVTNYIRESGLITPPGLTDSDNDGISDLGELQIGTDPNDDDSDSDGLSDGDEVNFVGTNPMMVTTASQTEVLRVMNINEATVTEVGEQLLIGHGAANQMMSATEVMPDGSTVLIGTSTSDKDGRFAIYTNELSEGNHSVFITSGEDEITDISAQFTINTVKFIGRPQYVAFGTTDGLISVDPMPKLSLMTSDSSTIVVVWQSTLYSQTLIADAADELIHLQPAENLENGDHTVTWYALDSETNQMSAPTRLNFQVATTAFVNGDANSPWILILGSIAVLTSLTSLALFFRGKKK